MSDPRLTPDPARITRRDAAQVARPVVNLMRQPGGPRDRQLLLGADVTVLNSDNGWAYVQAAQDGYCGHVAVADLSSPLTLSHKVTAAATHGYQQADMKSPDRVALSHGSRVAAVGGTDAFVETEHGFIPRQHLSPLDVMADDPAAVAALFVGTPYLWGGNSRWGIDCSGLVQAACTACGIPCPSDSDQQQRHLGTPLPEGTPPRRNDLLFWKGHVALVWDADRLLHANAHAMATVFEPLREAISRIADSDGPVTGHHRLLPETP